LLTKLRKQYGVPEVEKTEPTSKLEGIVQITKDLSNNITKSPSSPAREAPESGCMIIFVFSLIFSTSTKAIFHAELE
jgi:hypothetical protein